MLKPKTTSSRIFDLDFAALASLGCFLFRADSIRLHTSIDTKLLGLADHFPSSPISVDKNDQGNTVL